jgi:hypothetical protein
MRPEISTLYTSEREVEYTAPSNTAWRLSRAGMAAAMDDPTAAAAAAADGRKLSLRQQFGEPY